MIRTWYQILCRKNNKFYYTCGICQQIALRKMTVIWQLFAINQLTFQQILNFWWKDYGFGMSSYNSVLKIRQKWKIRSLIIFFYYVRYLRGLRKRGFGMYIVFCSLLVVLSWLMLWPSRPEELLRPTIESGSVPSFLNWHVCWLTPIHWIEYVLAHRPFLITTTYHFSWRHCTSTPFTKKVMVIQFLFIIKVKGVLKSLSHCDALEPNHHNY